MVSHFDPAFAVRPPLAVSQATHRWHPAGRVLRRLEAGGFSGQPVWLVAADGRQFVLKAFSAAMSPERARWIHARMRQARAAGISEVPAVQVADDGDSIVAAGGCSWELLDYVVGLQCSHPTLEQTAAALAVLARVHAAASEQPVRGVSRAFAERIAAAQRLTERPWTHLLAAAARSPATPLWSAVRERLLAAGRNWTQSSGDRWLALGAALECPIVSGQWVLRDIWSEHVLFAPGSAARVAGLIDYHASGVDTPATDVARLLGSWMEAEASLPDWWASRLAAYEAVRPLSAAERRGIPFLAASGVVFGLDNWFRWILEEGRQFASTAQVLGRVDRLMVALPASLEILADWATKRV
jgi:Ser/Thr protein kinase RdoA (MazF antagonist)